MKRSIKKSAKKTNVAKQWLVSYIFLFLIPIIISLIVFGFFEESVREETYKTNAVALNLLKSDMNHIFVSLKRVYMELSLNAKISKTATSLADKHQIGLSEAQELLKSAKTHIASNELVSRIYICFDAYGMALDTQSGVHDSDLINDVVFGDEEGVALRTFLDAHPKDGLSSLPLRDGEGTVDTVVYAGRLKMADGTEAKVMICANMDYLSRRMEDMSRVLQKDIAILDGSNQTIYATKPFAVNTQEEEMTLYREGKNVVMFTGLDVSNWRCAVSEPRHNFLKQVWKVRYLCLLGILFSLALGGVCIRYVMKKNYTPVKEVLNMIEKQRKKCIQNGENEYEFILQTLIESLRGEETRQKRLEEQEKLLKTNVLMNLLNNRDAALSDKIMTQLNFLSDTFTVVIFDVLNIDELFGEEPSMTHEQRQSTGIFIIDNIMSELIGKHHRCFFSDMGQKLVGIVSFSEERDMPERDLLEALNAGNAAIEENFGLLVNIIVGKICNGTENIGRCYREALELLEYVHITGMNGIVESDEICMDDEYSSSDEREVQLLSQIKMGMSEAAKATLQEIFGANASGKPLHPQQIKCLMLEISGSLLKLVNTNEESAAIMEICYADKDLLQAKAELTAIVEKLCEDYKTRMNSERTGLDESIKTYIEQHYYESGMNAQTLGDAFHLAPYYLSRSFKARNGIGVMEYLRKVRVERAKELIHENPHVKLETVAENVGFISTRNLTRAFKHELGILPNDYRKSLGRN